MGIAIKQLLTTSIPRFDRGNNIILLNTAAQKRSPLVRQIHVNSRKDNMSPVFSLEYVAQEWIPSD
jgi:hypothetical protein